jgi:hypothetical protein
MIRISITAAAFKAIAAALPLGSVGSVAHREGRALDLAQGKVTDLTEETG